MSTEESVFSRVQNLLHQHGVEFGVLRHQPVFTSQEAAAVRGVVLSSGAKALLCKVDDCFVMFVLPGDRKLDGKRVRLALGIRALRFATPQELQELTGLPPGAVPPFGSLFGLTTHCDAQLAQNEQINFNAGDRTISVSLRFKDYVQVENPNLGSFTEQQRMGLQANSNPALKREEFPCATAQVPVNNQPALANYENHFQISGPSCTFSQRPFSYGLIPVGRLASDGAREQTDHH